MRPQARLNNHYQRFERLIRFGAVGIGVSLVNSGLTVLFVQTRLLPDPAWAISVATLITMPLSFVSHRRVTYADAPRHGRQWPRFILLSLSSLACGAGAMKFAQSLGASYWLGLAFAWLAIPTANYIVNALYVFQVRTLFRIERTGNGDTQ